MYERKRTWIEDGPPWARLASVKPRVKPRGMGDTVTVAFPQVSDNSGTSSMIAPNPYGFLDDSTQYSFTTNGGLAPASQAIAAAASPCFSVAFPWVGSQVNGACKPAMNISPSVGIAITALAVGLVILKAVGR